MKTDRFLNGILVGIAVLIVASIAVFALRDTNQDYTVDDSPEGVVHNYALAVYNRDYNKAYTYLAEAPERPELATFQSAFYNRQMDTSNNGLEIGSTYFVDDATALVDVLIVYSSSDPFSSTYSSPDTAWLVLQNGVWKIKRMPYTMWMYDWYMEEIMPVKP